MHILTKAGIGAAIFAVTAAGVVYAGPSTTHDIDQAKLQFSVNTITISRGEKLRFNNSDRTAHNITVQGGGVFQDSGLQQPGEPTEIPFTKAGSFNVSCAIHPKMKMSVTVTE